MKTVNLAKALKMKNALVGEINRDKEVLTRENSRTDTNTSTVDRAQVFARITANIEKLIKLKTAIQSANVGLYGYLVMMEEAKTMIAYLKTLNTTDGVQKHQGYNGVVLETIHNAYLKQQDIDLKVASYQREIEALQDEVDAYNATTMISVEE